MSRFTLKLALFLAPFLAAFSLPALVLGVSGELLSADEIARRHFEGDRAAVYGPAYTNPDARYKLVSIGLHRPELVAIGSSRALELRADFFVDGERSFYNAGLLTERLYEFRRALEHLPQGCCQQLILVLDQWSFNANWPNAVDNPLYERELTGGSSDLLNSLQRGARVTWLDFAEGRLQPSQVLHESPNLGVMARARGNGFRWDGTYEYAEILRDPSKASDFAFKDTLERVATGTKRFEFGDAVDEAALDELRTLMALARAQGRDVVVLLPPFAPTLERALRRSPRHRYVGDIGRRARAIVEDAGYAFFDFGSCEPLGCTDTEFIDGIHAGSKTDARVLLEMASAVPWLDARVDQDALRARLARSGPGPELAPPESP